MKISVKDNTNRDPPLLPLWCQSKFVKWIHSVRSRFQYKADLWKRFFQDQLPQTSHRRQLRKYNLHVACRVHSGICNTPNPPKHTLSLLPHPSSPRCPVMYRYTPAAVFFKLWYVTLTLIEEWRSRWWERMIKNQFGHFICLFKVILKKDFF